jgi:hypothetical protein
MLPFRLYANKSINIITELSMPTLNQYSSLLVVSFITMLLLVEHIEFATVNGITNETCLADRDSSVFTSGSNAGNPPKATTGGEVRMNWTNNSESSMLEIDLGKQQRVCFIDIGWFNGEKSYPFRLFASYFSDTGFKEIYSGKSVASKLALQRIDFQDITARYLRITSTGNTSALPNITEINVYVYIPTSSGSRLPQLPNLALYDNFENKSTTDSRWDVVYTGHGFAGAITDKGNTKIYRMFPKTSTALDETHAGLVTSTKKFSDFKLVTDVRTDKQSRQNSRPNMWEVGWVFFRYTDIFHYYWFSLKPNGIEFGKKDCNDCVDPAEGQKILFTAALPTLRTSTWSQWTIEAINNHIMISVDGNKIIDYYDVNMGKELSSGQIAMYQEDARVSFDNFYINPYR